MYVCVRGLWSEHARACEGMHTVMCMVHLKSAFTTHSHILTHSRLEQNETGHDPNDYEIGKRHSLPVINVMNRDASINANGGAYEVRCCVG